MIEKRDVAVSIILSIITCGIYKIYWFIKLNDDICVLNEDYDETSGGIAFLFSILTCGIYTLYWMYKMGDKLDNVAFKNGSAQQSRGIVYLLLSIFRLSIISYALMQDFINKTVESTLS